MLSSLLTEAHERGFRLNNLFEHNSGLWQANLRSDSHATGWGLGETPEAALSAAIDSIETELVPLSFHTPVAHIDPSKPATETFNLAALLSANLRPRTANPFRGKL